MENQKSIKLAGQCDTPMPSTFFLSASVVLSWLGGSLFLGLIWFPIFINTTGSFDRVQIDYATMQWMFRVGTSILLASLAVLVLFSMFLIFRKYIFQHRMRLFILLPLAIVMVISIAFSFAIQLPVTVAAVVFIGSFPVFVIMLILVLTFRVAFVRKTYLAVFCGQFTTMVYLMIFHYIISQPSGPNNEVLRSFFAWEYAEILISSALPIFVAALIFYIRINWFLTANMSDEDDGNRFVNSAVINDVT